MYRFLAKLGKFKYAKATMPAMGLTVSTSYALWQIFGTDVVENFYSVRDGAKAKKIPEKLSQLIDQVTNDCVGVVHHLQKQVEKNGHSIRWFISAAPIYSGFADSPYGCIIGIPPYLEYESIRDIPEDQFNLTPLPLFKVKSDSEEDEEEDNDIDEKLLSNEGRPKTHKIDVNSEDGKNYVNSLLMSDNAKKFLIARQIFYTDTDQPSFNSGNSALAFFLPVTLSRVVVERFESIRRSVPYRVNFYILAGTFALIQFLVAKDIIQAFYDSKSDSRAASLGKDYLEGGIEYYSKCLQRNIAIRNTHKAFASSIEEDGNLKGGFLFRGLRRTELPLTIRLELLLKMQLDKN